MPAAVTMVTQPMEGETVSDPNPEIKANLAALGNVDPKSVTMRISGVGLVPATYDPETKLVSYKVTQKLYAGQVTVIVGATVNGRKTEARWSFNVGSKEAKEANRPKRLPKRAVRTGSRRSPSSRFLRRDLRK